MANVKHAYKMQILEAHLDSFGHVNNATYLQILEEARWDFVTPRGYGYKKIQETGVGPTILEVTLKFRREIMLREMITIETQMLGYEKKIGTIHQEIKGPDGELRAVADFKIALFDIKERRLIAPTKEWLEAVGIDSNASVS
jgi:YbgC/YbaW family acyl-CoA thioester hydrolase